jgi:hypothetical protein
MALNEDEQTEAVFKSSRTDIDPVSGNDVPPGSLPEEVRDDIPAMLSEGEYVVPADVLRFYGVKFFEDLRAQAKMGLAEMEANGRIGGEPIEAEEDDLPFNDEELMVEEDSIPSEEEMSAALGGLVGYNEGGAQLDVFGSDQFQQDPNDPTQVLIGSQPGGTGYELVTYYGPAGQEITIPFFNGMPLGVVPTGYTKNKPQETTIQEVSVDDNNFDAASAERARKRIAEAEKKEINFSNPEDVMSAVDTYYSSQGLLGKAGTAIFGIPGLIGAKLIGRYEKNKLIEGIDSALADESIEEGIREKLTLQRSYLEDKDAYVKDKEKEGKKLGFLDALKSAFSSEEIDKRYTKPEGLTNEQWKDASIGEWVDATNLVNSLGSDADPREWSEAIRAQSEASRQASAAIRAESGWTGGFFGSASNDDDDDTPSSNNSSTTSNTNTSSSGYSNTDSWEDDEGFGVG